MNLVVATIHLITCSLETLSLSRPAVRTFAGAGLWGSWDALPPCRLFPERVVPVALSSTAKTGGKERLGVQQSAVSFCCGRVTGLLFVSAKSVPLLAAAVLMRFTRLSSYFGVSSTNVPMSISAAVSCFQQKAAVSVHTKCLSILRSVETTV